MSELMDDIHSVDRDKMAALLSIIPGLGHIYKHHYISGFGFLVGSNILVGFISGLMILATFGLSFFIPLIYVGAVMATAYKLEDWRDRHKKEKTAEAEEPAV